MSKRSTGRASSPSIYPSASTPPASSSRSGKQSLATQKSSKATDTTSSNIKVIVRVRPRILPREANSPILIQMGSDGRTTTLLPKNMANSSPSDSKSFQFDHCLWSVRSTDDNYKSQRDTFELVGKDIIQHTLAGFNTCILAYGQTGSGKSYTMMGSNEDEDQQGIIPQSCKELWDQVQQLQNIRKRFHLKVSYFEIYNEQVHDLLASNSESRVKLKVRENPQTGPYVEGLTEFQITKLEDFNKYLKMGDVNRTVAQTKMNDNSSRSHAVFSINLKIREFGINLDGVESSSDSFSETEDYIKETNSSLRLVDLAGSERVTSTGATGVRMKEGTNINKSLTTLGRVILSLSDRGDGPNNNSVASKPPYRDSVLTWLLKENLGGNSKTVMVACISPCDYEETLSTLRYATLTQKVRLVARANIDEIQHHNNIENDRKQKQKMEDELIKMKLQIEEMTSNSISETQKNEEIIRQVTNLSKFFEDRLSIQTEKYQIVKEELIKERSHRKKLQDSLNGIVKTLEMIDSKDPDYEEDLWKQSNLLNQRSYNFQIEIMKDLEKFCP
ncbi:hypothetical protein WICPIJ_008407 [Wickerhamomyces pijperi]|uniref:Kinesin-like protein n=1 Tax=Wickerhamomyces pijperi TaxID=599730 RepID=A0A9P8PYV2_WICPI|nr:hypothetical protein WICPIJ_008407 [Wickerhamomyces pijperi]